LLLKQQKREKEEEKRAGLGEFLGHNSPSTHPLNIGRERGNAQTTKEEGRNIEKADFETK
jgi:hypothetical protein